MRALSSPRQAIMISSATAANALTLQTSTGSPLISRRILFSENPAREPLPAAQRMAEIMR